MSGPCLAKLRPLAPLAHHLLSKTWARLNTEVCIEQPLKLREARWLVLGDILVLFEVPLFEEQFLVTNCLLQLFLIVLLFLGLRENFVLGFKEVNRLLKLRCLCLDNDELIGRIRASRIAATLGIGGG